MIHSRTPGQVAGLTLGLVLGLYSGYLQYDLIDSGVYRAVFENLVTGWTLANALANIAAACTMTIGGTLALVALGNSTATVGATGKSFIIAAGTWVAGEIAALAAVSKELDSYSAAGMMTRETTWGIYIDSVEYATFPNKWPVIWTTAVACAIIGVLAHRTGETCAHAAARPPVPAAPEAGTFHVHAGGLHYGPYDLGQLRSLVSEGRVVAATLVWPGHGDWIPAATVPGLISA